MSAKQGPLFTGAEWDLDLIQRMYDAIEPIALNELGLSVYENQIDIVTYEQMMDLYSTTGLPIMYKHWSFGKQFATVERLYRTGKMFLALEMVANSDPCRSHLLEENTATEQATVIAHAAFGHNHFFKNNHVFKQWTDAASIMGYLSFAERYVARCEREYGEKAVERVLDAAHALSGQGIDHVRRVDPPSLAMEEKRQQEREKDALDSYNYLWSTLPREQKTVPPVIMERADRFKLPEENLLYFLETYSPILKPWERELIRIVRTIAQYFYPQRLTKVMNEGCASDVHYTIMTRLNHKGLLTDGAYVDFLTSHTNLITQLDFDDGRGYRGFNPYALGFKISQDIGRITMDPTEEDREWFPNIAGCRDPWNVKRDAWANYKDESFIFQFLSPKVIRDFQLFRLLDSESVPEYLVNAIHNERGYRAIRSSLARMYDPSHASPDIQVVDVNLEGDRQVVIHNKVMDGIYLHEPTINKVLMYFGSLWGYPVLLKEVNDSGVVLKQYSIVAPTRN